MQKNRGHEPLDPEAVAIAALGHLADRPDLLMRFCDVTGVTPADIVDAAGSRNFLAGVLAFVLHDDRLVMDIAAEHGWPPEALPTAHAALDGRP